MLLDLHNPSLLATVKLRLNNNKNKNQVIVCTVRLWSCQFCLFFVFVFFVCFFFLLFCYIFYVYQLRYIIPDGSNICFGFYNRNSVLKIFYIVSLTYKTAPRRSLPQDCLDVTTCSQYFYLVETMLEDWDWEVFKAIFLNIRNSHQGRRFQWQ